jgi:hypothetical protein
MPIPPKIVPRSKNVRDVVTVVIAAIGLFVAIYSALDAHSSVALDERVFVSATAFRDISRCKNSADEDAGRCKNDLGIVAFKASGKTRASDIQVRLSCGMSNDLDNPQKHIGEPIDRPFPTLLNPGETEEVVCETTYQDLQAYAVRGLVAYKDIFGMKHATEFCFTDSGSLLLPDPSNGKLNLKQCSSGNAMDRTP